MSGQGAKSGRAWAIAAGLAGLAAGAGAMAYYQGAADPGRTEVEAVVRDYILANPEIIPEAMDRLRTREAAAVVAENRDALETPFGGGWAGAEDGDVVLVEFFDYACGYCRAAKADVARLLAEDEGLKVVWRELPVLGPESEEAAAASLAAARLGPGRYREFHQTLFGLGRPTEANVAAAARQANLGAEAIAASRGAAETEAELRRNIALAQAIGASGTPTFVIGDRVLQGAVGYEALKQAVAEARKEQT